MNPPNAKLPDSPEPPLEQDWILCVDDTPDNLTLLREDLEDEGFGVLTANDGPAALKEIERSPPSAVLLDWQMPEMSGIEVLCELRKTYDPTQLPVIMVTALTADQHVVESLNCGANDYVGKPIDIDILLARLRAHLRIRKLAKERIGLLERLKSLSLTDPLTEVSNRRAFSEQGTAQFSHARRHQTELAVVIFDADHFKSINDTFGHEVGDKVLLAIANSLDGARRKEDVLARIGGEEFALICPSSSAADAQVIAERCREGIASLRIDELPDDRPITVSAGVAELDPNHANFSALVRDADAAMYCAKQNGRNRVCLPEPRLAATG